MILIKDYKHCQTKILDKKINQLKKIIKNLNLKLKHNSGKRQLNKWQRNNKLKKKNLSLIIQKAKMKKNQKIKTYEETHSITCQRVYKAITNNKKQKKTQLIMNYWPII